MDDIIEQIAQQCGARELTALGLLSRRQVSILNDVGIWRPLFGAMPIYNVTNSRNYILAAHAEEKVRAILNTQRRIRLKSNYTAAQYLLEHLSSISHHWKKEPIKNWNFELRKHNADVYYLVVIDKCRWGSRIETPDVIILLRKLYHNY